MPIIAGLPTENTNFIPRESLSKSTEEELSKYQVAVLFAPPGTGKTQLVKALAYKAIKDNAYDFIIWLPAETPATLLAGCAQATQKLRLSPKKGEETLLTLKNFLENTKKKWLLIFDNVEDPVLIDTYRPSLNGHTLITSRKDNWPRYITVRQGLNHDEAVLWLATILNRTTELEEETTKQKFIDEIAPVLRKISMDNNNKGYHALTVSLTGFYIRAQLTLGKSMSECTKEFDNLEKLINKSEELTRLANYNQNLMSLSLPINALNIVSQGNDLKTEAPATLALNIINLCAFGYADQIPMWFIKSIVQAEKLDASIDLLVKYGLANREDEGASISVHRLVQAAIRARLTADQQTKHFDRMLNFLLESFNWTRVKNEQIINLDKDPIFLSNIEALLILGKEKEWLEGEPYKVARLLNSLGRYYFVQDLLPLAQKYYIQAKELFEKAEKQNPEKINNEEAQWFYAAEILHNVGAVTLRDWQAASDQSRKEALAALELSYQKQKQIITGAKSHLVNYDNKHATSYTRRMLARAYKMQGNHLKAQQEFEELLTDKDYIETATGQPAKITEALAYVDLGVIYKLQEDKNKNQGKPADYKLAITTLQKSIKIYESPDLVDNKNKDKDLAVALIRLGEAHFANQEFDEAERNFLKANTHNNKTQEKKSPISEARIYYRFAEIAYTQKYYARAKAFIDQTMTFQQKIYASDHPYIKESLLLAKDIELNLSGQNIKTPDSVRKISKGSSELERLKELDKVLAQTVIGLKQILQRADILSAVTQYPAALKDAINCYNSIIEQIAKPDSNNFIIKDELMYWEVIAKRADTHFRLGSVDDLEAPTHYDAAKKDYELLLTPSNKKLTETEKEEIKKKQDSVMSKIFSIQNKQKFQKVISSSFSTNLSKGSIFINTLNETLSAKIINHYRLIAEGLEEIKDKTQIAGVIISAFGSAAQAKVETGSVGIDISLKPLFEESAKLMVDQHLAKRKAKAIRIINATNKDHELNINPFIDFAKELADVFEKQLNILKPESARLFAKYIAQKILDYLGSEANISPLTVTKLKTNLLFTPSTKFFRNNPKLTKEEPKPNEEQWTAEGLLERSGFKIKNQNYYIRKDMENDRHEKYGFAEIRNSDFFGNGILQYLESTSVDELNKAKTDYLEQQKKSRCTHM